ncbi:MAG: DnaJ domain-containing protein, partial [Christiangramia sp.]|nr:DnaJ domain-containing protein [Christiangramia sp.]
MEFIDYYKLLELDKSASQADIKKSYRKLAR